jgi:hypothetical protein
MGCKSSKDAQKLEAPSSSRSKDYVVGEGAVRPQHDHRVEDASKESAKDGNQQQQQKTLEPLHSSSKNEPEVTQRSAPVIDLDMVQRVEALERRMDVLISSSTSTSTSHESHSASPLESLESKVQDLLDVIEKLS